MWLISLITALSLLVFAIFMSIFTKKDWKYTTNTLKKLPYELIPFFLSMFVIVVAINYQGIASKISEVLGNSNEVWTYGYSSFMASNLINNIPMSILYSNICSNKAMTYASIVGSNIGAFLTPIGALAGIMFTELVNKHGIKYKFIEFVKYGLITAIPVITVALASLLITV